MQKKVSAMKNGSQNNNISFRNIFSNYCFGVDTLIFFSFSLVYFRQAAWIFPSQNFLLTWGFSIMATITVSIVYSSFSNKYKCKIPLYVYLGFIPILTVYIMKLGFVDTSYDVIARRIVVWESALRGQPFFGLANLYTPMSSMINEMQHGLYFHLFGYRLGTIINILVLLWLYREVYLIFYQSIQNRLFSLCSAAFTLIGIENILWEINTYMPDLLGLPFLFYGLRITLQRKQLALSDFFFVSLLYGIFFTYKWTNIIFIIPSFFLIFFYNYRQNTFKDYTRIILLVLLAFVIPSLPSSAYYYYLTQNPFFPMFNAFFKSPYFQTQNMLGTDMTIRGPQSLAETLLWPIISSFDPSRIALQLHRYSGRLFLGCVCSLLILFNRFRPWFWAVFSYLFFTSAMIWSFSAGHIIRYAIPIDIIAGILFCFTSWSLFKKINENRLIKKYFFTISFYFITIIAISQVTHGLLDGSVTNWNLRTWPTYKQAFSQYNKLFNDHSLVDYTYKYEKDLITKLNGFWLYPPSDWTAQMALLRPDMIFIGLNKNATTEFISKNQKSVYYSLFPFKNLDEMINKITLFELYPTNLEYFEFTLFGEKCSPNMVCPNMVLLEAKASPSKIITRTKSANYLTNDALKAKFESIISTTVLTQEQVFKFQVAITNTSDYTWNYTQAGIPFTLGYHLLDEHADTTLYSAKSEFSLLYDLPPNETAILPLYIKAPIKNGEYFLKFDLFHNDWVIGEGQSDNLLHLLVIPKNSNLKLAETLYFKKGDATILPYYMKGLSGQEAERTWSSGKETIFSFNIKDDIADRKELYLNFTASPLCGKDLLFQTVHISANGAPITTLKIDKDGDYQASIPTDIIQDNLLIIKFELPDAATPKSLGLNNDERILALFFKKMSIN
jgi:hypothetical protein